MPTRSKGLGPRTRRGEDAWRLPGGLQPLHPPLPLPGGLVRVLGAVVEIAGLAMGHPREALPRRGASTLQLVRHAHPWYARQALEPLAEEFLRGLLVPAALPEHIQDVAVLIHRPPLSTYWPPYPTPDQYGIITPAMKAK